MTAAQVAERLAWWRHELATARNLLRQAMRDAIEFDASLGNATPEYLERREIDRLRIRENEAEDRWRVALLTVRELEAQHVSAELDERRNES